MPTTPVLGREEGSGTRSDGQFAHAWARRQYMRGGEVWDEKVVANKSHALLFLPWDQDQKRESKTDR